MRLIPLRNYKYRSGPKISLQDLVYEIWIEELIQQYISLVVHFSTPIWCLYFGYHGPSARFRNLIARQAQILGCEECFDLRAMKWFCLPLQGEPSWKTFTKPLANSVEWQKLVKHQMVYVGVICPADG